MDRVEGRSCRGFVFCVKQIVVHHIGSYLNEFCHPFEQKMHSQCVMNFRLTLCSHLDLHGGIQVCPSPCQRDVFPMHWA